MVGIQEVAEHRGRGPYGVDGEPRTLRPPGEAASDGGVPHHLRRGVAGEGTARRDVLRVDDQGVPVGLDQPDPASGAGDQAELREDGIGIVDVHEDPVDPGPVHRPRVDRQSVRVPFAELHRGR
ncbi:hypothetical protein ACVWXU_000737 [Streptomyces sp. TE33382]